MTVRRQGDSRGIPDVDKRATFDLPSKACQGYRGVGKAGDVGEYVGEGKQTDESDETISGSLKADGSIPRYRSDGGRKNDLRIDHVPKTLEHGDDDRAHPISLRAFDTDQEGSSGTHGQSVPDLHPIDDLDPTYPETQGKRQEQGEIYACLFKRPGEGPRPTQPFELAQERAVQFLDEGRFHRKGLSDPYG